MIEQVSKDVAESIGLGKAVGAVVRSVEAGSPAEKAGIEAGDIITRFEGKSIEKSSELPRAIGYPRDRLGVSKLHWPRPLQRAGATALRQVMPARVPVLLRWAHANTLSLHHTLCSRAAVATAHRLGAPVLAWTVNDPAGVRRVAAAGVDGIVSDDPEMTLATLLAL